MYSNNCFNAYARCNVHPYDCFSAYATCKVHAYDCFNAYASCKVHPNNCFCAYAACISIHTTVFMLMQAAASHRQIIIPAGILTDGTYSYNLIADGKQVDSKKMVVVK